MYFIILSIFVVFLFILYEYLIWHHQYWIKRGVPGPKPHILTGSFPKSFMQKENMIDEVDRIYREYKGTTPYVGIFSSRLPQLLIIDNELIKNVLIRDFKNFHDNEFADATNKESDPIFSRNPFMLSGEEWKEKRAEITPAFTASRLRTMFPKIDDVCKKMNLYIERQLIDKEIITDIDTKELAAKFTVDVVSSCIYGVDSKAFTDEKSIIRQMGTTLFAPNTKLLIYFTIVTIFPFIAKFYTMPFVAKETESFFTQLMKDAIKMREIDGTNVEREDFLNYLLELRKKKKISELEMAAHTITFFLDGFETSSVVIAHMLYLLAKHPNVQQRLRDEIHESMKKNKNDAISYENLNDMVYLDQIFNETVRLYPPAGGSTRKCTIPAEFCDYKDKKLALEKDIVAMISVWSVHRDPEHYSIPDEFNPDRFSPDNGGIKSYKDKGVFLAFGEGPRICLGMRFGTIQSKAAIVEIVKNYIIQPNSKTHDEYVIDPKTFITMPRGGLWINLKKLPNN